MSSLLPDRDVPESGQLVDAPLAEDLRLVLDLSDGNEVSGEQPSVGRHRWADVLPTVSVIIPALNEAENLPHVLSEIPTWVTEVILVDGRSIDDTVAVARREREDIKIVMQPGRGKGDAMRAGFEAASGDIFVAIDADGSMDPREIHSLVGALVAGADLAKGSRFVQGGGTLDITRFRRFGNWGLMKVTKLLFGGSFSDLCYGYVSFWRRTLDDISPDVDGFEIEALINVRALRHNLRIAEVPSFESARLHGQGNLRAIPDGWRILKTIVRERFSRRQPSSH